MLEIVRLSNCAASEAFCTTVVLFSLFQVSDARRNVGVGVVHSESQTVNTSTVSLHLPSTRNAQPCLCLCCLLSREGGEGRGGVGWGGDGERCGALLLLPPPKHVMKDGQHTQRAICFHIVDVVCSGGRAHLLLAKRACVFCVPVVGSESSRHAILPFRLVAGCCATL